MSISNGFVVSGWWKVLRGESANRTGSNDAEAQNPSEPAMSLFSPSPDCLIEKDFKNVTFLLKFFLIKYPTKSFWPVRLASTSGKR